MVIDDWFGLVEINVCLGNMVEVVGEDVQSQLALHGIEQLPGFSSR